MLKSASTVLALASAIGCHAGTPATEALSSSAPREAPRLVWDGVLSQWTAIDVGVGRAKRRLPLDSIEDRCLPLLLASDARVVDHDLDGDGAQDLALWSPSEPCWALWTAWRSGPSRLPAELTLRCSDAANQANAKLCWGSRLSLEETDEWPPIVIVIRNDRIDQIVLDPDFGPGGSLELADVTFDGRPDLLVPIGPGCAGNCYVNVWPYSARSDRFVASTSLSRLANVDVIDPTARLLESRECRGQACALFTAQLLEVDGTDARIIAKATQDDASIGSATKRLRVTSLVHDRASTLACEALVDPDGTFLQRLSGTCDRWPRR